MKQPEDMKRPDGPDRVEAWFRDGIDDVAWVFGVQCSGRDLATLAKWCDDAAKYIQECQKKTTYGQKTQR